MQFSLRRLGIRTKLITLFLAIKVIPLILLALIAWEGVSGLGKNVAAVADGWSVEVLGLAAGMGKSFTQAAERSLNDRAREELERLTTDTARAAADFLYDRDRDILLAAQLEPSKEVYRHLVANRTRGLIDPGKWKLADDGKAWIPVVAPPDPPPTILPDNPENRQDFHYRPPESALRTVQRPLYHEITFVGLDGREKIKVSTSTILSPALHDVSKRENTYCQAEGYFAELAKLRPGQIWVSEVIGPYVGSRIIGSATPEKATGLGISFAPEQEAYAGRENPVGKKFKGIIRWATPVVRNGKIVGYVTLALDHAHVMSFTDNLLPTPARYSSIADASDGNYAFMWDYLDRSIAHPRHHSIVGIDPASGDYAVPWLPADLYDNWQQSGQSLRQYLAGVPAFDRQSRDKKPAKALSQAGSIGLECRFLNFAPQCQGWHDLTKAGGSGSFLIQWSGVWKITTAASIPYRTGQYNKTPRGFGYVTIGANIDDFRQPAVRTGTRINARVDEFDQHMRRQQVGMHTRVTETMAGIARNLTLATLLMILAVIAIAVWLASVLTRRITTLTAGLQRIEQGDFSHRLAKTSTDEIGNLTDSLNRMAYSVELSFKRQEDYQLDALRKSEQQHRQVVDNASEGILVIQDSRIVLANPKFEQMTGFPLEELYKLSFLELIHPDDQDLVAAAEQHQLHGEAPAIRYSFRLARRDHPTLWVALSAVPIEWLGQAATLSFVTDVTESRRLDDHLKEVLAERETILEHSVVGIAFLNPEGRPLWANQAMGQLFGVDPAATLGTSLEPYFHSRDEYLDVGKLVLEAVQTRQPFTGEVNMRRAEGTSFWAHISGKAVNPDDLARGTVWVVSDISQRRELEEKLVRTTAEWGIILQSTLIGISYTSNRILRFVNKTFADMVGYEPEELIGQGSQIYYPDEKSWRQTGERAYPVLARGEAFAEEKRLKRKNGEIFWAQVYGMSIYPNDPAQGIIWTMIDISERRKAEEDILGALEQQRELNDLKSRFVSMTSHEFRTPLATILSSAELLRYYSDRLSKEEKDEMLGNIDTSVMRMTHMLDNILMIGRADAGQLEFKPAPVYVDVFCRKLVEEVAKAAMQGGNGFGRFHYACARSDEVVWLDEKLLQHVLGNLLSNAFKYSPNGQPVHFDIDSDDKEIRFRIADQGIGIPAEHLPRLFETFHRARNVGNISGTGLGMAIVKRALDLHGGKIRVESEVGCGSTFTVTLPKQLPTESAE